MPRHDVSKKAPGEVLRTGKVKVRLDENGRPVILEEERLPTVTSSEKPADPAPRENPLPIPEVAKYYGGI